MERVLIDHTTSLGASVDSCRMLDVLVCVADACARGHEQFCEGVAKQMPTEEAAAAVRDGCRDLKMKRQERLGRSYSSCRDVFAVLAAAGECEVSKCHTVQPSSGELEAIHLRVNNLFKELQRLRQQCASYDRQELAHVASSVPQDPLNIDESLGAIMDDAEQLEELWQSLAQLRPQLESQLNAVGSCEADETSEPWGSAP